MEAGKLIRTAARFHLADTPGENLVQQRFGVRSADLDRQLAGVTKDDIGAHSPIHLIVCGGIQFFRGKS